MKKILLIIILCNAILYGQDYIENNAFYVCFPQNNELWAGSDGDLIKYDTRDTLECFSINSVIFAEFDSNHTGFCLKGNNTGSLSGSRLTACYLIEGQNSEKPKLINVFIDLWDSGGNRGTPSQTLHEFYNDENGYLKIIEAEGYVDGVIDTEYKFNGNMYVKEEE